MGIQHKTFTACYPGKSFPSVSVTGKQCEELCEHCKAHYLDGMLPAKTDEELLSLAQRVIERGGTGMLISGGCDKDGSVPISKNIGAIRNMTKAGMQINVHAGFIDRADAEDLVAAGVSRFSVDIHQDPRVIKSVFHLERNPEDYSMLIDDLSRAGAKIVPHLTVGFGYTDLIRSAHLLKSKGLNDVVLLSLIPTKGTPMEGAIVTEDMILDSLIVLSDMGLNVTLGCMRDRGMRELEKKCIEFGVRRIANPSQETVRWAENEGYNVVIEYACCSMTF